MAAVREAGCVDALVSLAPDLHPSAITFSLAPTTAATAREICLGVNKELKEKEIKVIFCIVSFPLPHCAPSSLSHTHTLLLIANTLSWDGFSLIHLQPNPHKHHQLH